LRSSVHRRGQPAKGLVVGLVACRGDQPFEAGHARPHNLFTGELLTRQLQQQGRLVMFERPLDQPGVQGREIERCGSTKLQVGLHMELMIRLGSPPARIQGKHAWINFQLLGHERDYLVWGRLAVVRHKAEIAEDTELEGIAQTILGVSLAPDFPGILSR
jgi:hypothetical protein